MTAILPQQRLYHQSSDDTGKPITLQSSKPPSQKAVDGQIISPLTLRTIRLEDELSVQAILTERENIKDDLSMVDVKPKELTVIIKSWTIHSDPLTSFQFMVTIANRPVGLAGFGWMGKSSVVTDTSAPARVGAAGIVINPDARGRGYGFEALQMVIDYGLRELKLDRVDLGTTSRNTAMRKLMEDKFEMPAIVTEPDRFGNDLEWRISPDTWAAWLRKHS